MRKNKSGKSKSRKEIQSFVTYAATIHHDHDGNVKDSIQIVNDRAEKNLDVPSHESRVDVSERDSLNFDYHSSLCTQTQDGGVEVVWDWHSPIRKNIDSNGNNARTHETPSSSTPKRDSTVYKKRVSNSPLMYKSLKRKLIKQENTDDIDKFKAELIALSEQIKNARKNEKLPVDVSDSIVKNDIPGEIEFKEWNDDGVACINNKVYRTSTEDDLEKNNEFHELFNDSLNDTLIRCSQEIEERLNIAPVNFEKRNNNDTLGKQEGNNFFVRNKSYCQSMNMNENSNNNSTMMKQNMNVQTIKQSSGNASKFTMQKCKSDTTISKTVMQTYSTSTKTTGTSSNIISHTKQQQSESQSKDNKLSVEDRNNLSIPDDSFDEFLATCDEDFSQSDINFISTSADRRSKICDSGHSESSITSNNSSPAVSSKSSSSTPMKNTNNFSERNILRTNVMQNSNIDNSTIRSKLGPFPSSSVKRDWKFFKSKSHSDSAFTNDNGKIVNPSNKSPNQSGLTRMVTGSSVSTKHQIPPMHRATSCLDSNTITGKSAQKVNAYNTQMYNVNRCAAKEDGDGTNNHSSGSRNAGSNIRSLRLCGPEEIARKRMEAKMKLEAKKKREKMRNKSGSDFVTRNER